MKQNKEPCYKSYEQMNAWEQMECRMGHYMFSKVINHKIYYKVN